MCFLKNFRKIAKILKWHKYFQITLGRISWASLFACFTGKQTGQSLRSQCLQWLIICLDMLQRGIIQDLPASQFGMWFKTFVMVSQSGKVHCLISPFVWLSCRRHFSACRISSNSFCMSLHFSGSGIDFTPKSNKVRIEQRHCNK